MNRAEQLRAYRLHVKGRALLAMWEHISRMPLYAALIGGYDFDLLERVKHGSSH